jgi:aryl-alcohol dehydrogenase-like predicted oxidoreductase
LLQSSKISFGISIYTKKEFNKVINNKQVDILQVPHNILNRQIDQDCFDLATKYNKKIIIRSVFLQGILSSNWKNLINKLPELQHVLKQIHDIASKHKYTLEECAFAWLHSFYNIYGVIIGVENLEQLRANYKNFSNIKNNSELIKDLEKLIIPDPNVVDPRFWKYENI